MPLRLKSPIPDISGVTEWLNNPVTLQELVGKPTLIYFWSVSCHICHENMPRLQEWRRVFTPKGLQMVAIHAPRQESDMDIAVVRAKMAEYEIIEPCAVDNSHTVIDTFENQFWPAYFLFDAQGLLRRRAAGDAGLATLTPIMEQLFTPSTE